MTNAYANSILTKDFGELVYVECNTILTSCGISVNVSMPRWVKVVKYRLKMKSCRFMGHQNYRYRKRLQAVLLSPLFSLQFRPNFCHICFWIQDLSLLESPCPHKTLILSLPKYNTLASQCLALKFMKWHMGIIFYGSLGKIRSCSEGASCTSCGGEVFVMDL